MNNLIKLSIVVLLLSIGSDSFAQTFGIKAGLNLSNSRIKDDDDTLSDDFIMNPGFHIGPTVEFPINELFSFESGLLLSTKGFKVSDKGTHMGETYDYKQKMNLLYLDVPLTAKASYDIGGAKIYGTFGPYIGMGLSGKAKYEAAGHTDEDDINFGSDEDDDDFKRFDYGLTAGAGIDFNAIQIGITYGLGLANISNNTDDGYKINNQCRLVSENSQKA